MKDNKIIVIRLGKKKNDFLKKISSDSDILYLDQNDIELLKKIKPLLKKYFKRPWAYTGSNNPSEINLEYLKKLEKIRVKFTQVEYKRILDLTVERKLPIDLRIALFEGDINELHTHKIFPPKKTSFQIEFYIITESQKVNIEYIQNKKKQLLKLIGPALVMIGDIPHRRINGECFVMKHISGTYKQIYSTL